MKILFVFLYLFLCGQIVFANIDVCQKESSIKDVLEKDLKKICSDITIDELKSLTVLAINPATSGYRVYQAKDFEGLENLKALFFYDIYQEFSEGAFDNLTSLEALHIDSKRLPQGLFKNLKNLRQLYISGDFTSLPSNLFDENSNIQYLGITGDLTTIPANIFDKLLKLEKLSLSWNKLSSLPSGVFDYNTKLKILDLNRNQLQTFPSGIFSRLSDLKALCLFNNPIESLKNGVFANLKMLEQLRLTPSEGLLSLEEGVFSDLASLKFLTLRLSSNFTDLPEGVFSNGNFKNQAHVYFLQSISEITNTVQKSIERDLGYRADFNYLISEDHWRCGDNPN
ncbi:MAG: leucine-rich repeat protein [Bdellovibrionota bacterium]